MVEVDLGDPNQIIRTLLTRILFSIPPNPLIPLHIYVVHKKVLQPQASSLILSMYIAISQPRIPFELVFQSSILCLYRQTEITLIADATQVSTIHPFIHCSICPVQALTRLPDMSSY